jgi:hypothetical protein
MNIIKSTKLIKCICQRCSSELEVAPEDIKTSDIGHSFGEWFTCPVCNKSNSMDGKIPSDWVSIVYKNEPV